MRVCFALLLVLAMLGTATEAQALFGKRKHQQQEGVKSFREIVKPVVPVKPKRCLTGKTKWGKCRLGV
jgi:hypothetical protein